MRSAGKSDRSIERQSSTVSGSILNSKRAANWAARRTRRLSSANVSVRNRAQDLLLKIIAAMERIENLLRQRILQNRINRKVAPSRRFFERHRRIAFDEKPAMSAAGLSLPPRHRNIQVRAEFVNRERFADDIHIAELIQQLAQSRRLNPINFEIPIFRLPGPSIHRAHSRRPAARGHLRRARPWPDQ